MDLSMLDVFYNWDHIIISLLSLLSLHMFLRCFITFVAEEHPPACTSSDLHVHLCLDGHVHYFCFVTPLNGAAVNMQACVFECLFSILLLKCGLWEHKIIPCLVFCRNSCVLLKHLPKGNIIDKLNILMNFSASCTDGVGGPHSLLWGSETWAASMTSTQ